MPFDKEALKASEDTIRDIKNWLQVFEVADEAKKVLGEKLDAIADGIGHCENENDVRNCENTIRDTKNWLAVFKGEYDLSDEAVNTIHEKLDALADSIGHAMK